MKCIGSYLKVTLETMIYLIVPFQPIYAQSLSGHIFDEDRLPISYATITIANDSLSGLTPYVYGTSNSNGYFSIVNSKITDSDWVTVRCLGYNEQTYRMSNLKNPVTFILDFDSQTLDEIIVKAQYAGVKFSNDTVRFDTNHYKTGTETNIGEVLKKMPGVDVATTGKVSYAGRNVNKILVDGKDIFDSGNSLIINTLSADLMSGAEILTNYTTNSLVDSYKTEETVALNIKTSAHKRASGNVDFDGGAYNKFNGKSAVLYLNDRFSLSTLISTNNTGTPVFSIEDYVNNIIGVDNVISQRSQSLKLSEEETQMLLPPANVYKQTVGAISVNTSYTPSDKFKFKSNVLYNGSCLDAKSESQYDYYSSNLLSTISDFERNTNHYFTASLRETWKPNDRFELNSSTFINYSNFRTSQNVENKSQFTVNTLQNNILNRCGIVQDISINRRLSKGLLYINTLFKFTRNAKALTISTDNPILPVDYDADGNEYLNVNDANGNNLSISPEIGYIMPLCKNININTSLLYVHKKDVYEYDEGILFDSESYNCDKLSVSVAMEKNVGKFNFDTGAALNYNHIALSNVDMRKSKCFVSPFVTMQMKFSQKHKLAVAVSLDSSPMEYEYLSRISRVTSYNQIFGGSSVTQPLQKELKLSMSYYLYDLFSNTFFILLAGYDKSIDNAMHATVQNGIVSTNYYVGNGKSGRFFARLNLNKGFGYIKTKLTAGYNDFANTVLINTNSSEVLHKTIYTNLDFVSNYKSIFNGELSVGYSHDHNRINHFNIRNTNQEFQTTAKLHYAHNRINGVFYGTYIRLLGSIYEKDIFDIGFNLEYMVRKICIRFGGSNLLNLKNFGWFGTEVTTSYARTSFYKKIPGYILFGIRYSF